MTPQMQEYVAGRERQIRMWKWAGPAIALLVLFFFGSLYLLHPLYLDPFFLKQQIESRQLLPADMALLGVLGNIAFVACGLLILVLLLVTSLSLWNESKLIAIIRSQSGNALPADSAEGEEGAGPG